MISKRTARLMSALPEPIGRFFAKFMINKYISKYANINVVNEHRLKDIKEPVIFIANHLSNSDGPVVNRVLKDFDVTFVAGVKLSKNSLTNLGIGVIKTIPINPNTADKTAITQTIKHIKSGKSIFIFPEGTRSRTSSMIEAKKGILLIAKMTNVPIVPIGIEGTEKLLPINDKDMGSEKFNYADVTITIGKQFYLPERFDGEGKHEYEDRALNYTMTNIAELLSYEYRGFYADDK